MAEASEIRLTFTIASNSFLSKVCWFFEGKIYIYIYDDTVVVSRNKDKIVD